MLAVVMVSLTEKKSGRWNFVLARPFRVGSHWRSGWTDIDLDSLLGGHADRSITGAGSQGVSFIQGAVWQMPLRAGSGSKDVRQCTRVGRGMGSAASSWRASTIPMISSAAGSGRRHRCRPGA
jgi:hypothetical protein